MEQRNERNMSEKMRKRRGQEGGESGEGHISNPHTFGIYLKTSMPHKRVWFWFWFGVHSGVGVHKQTFRRDSIPVGVECVWFVPVDCTHISHISHLLSHKCTWC